MSGTTTLELPRSAGSASIARLIVTAHGAALSSERLKSANLMISELVSNACRHGSGRIELCVHSSADGMRATVQDEGRSRDERKHGTGVGREVVLERRGRHVGVRRESHVAAERRDLDTARAGDEEPREHLRRQRPVDTDEVGDGATRRAPWQHRGRGSMDPGPRRGDEEEVVLRTAPRPR